MKILLALVTAILLIGYLDLPIGYYTFLRIAVTIGAVIVIVTEFENEINGWILIFGLIAILFNPIIPVYLHNKGIWKVIDLLSSLVFLSKIFYAKPSKS